MTNQEKNQRGRESLFYAFKLFLLTIVVIVITLLCVHFYQTTVNNVNYDRSNNVWSQKY